jgi:hypothetical protein
VGEKYHDIKNKHVVKNILGGVCGMEVFLNVRVQLHPEHQVEVHLYLRRLHHLQKRQVEVLNLQVVCWFLKMVFLFSQCEQQEYQKLMLKYQKL